MLITAFADKLKGVGHALQSLPSASDSLSDEHTDFIVHALGALLPSDAQPYCIASVIASPQMFPRRGPQVVSLEHKEIAPIRVAA